MKNYLVQQTIDGEVFSRIYSEAELISFVDMKDCYPEYDVHIFDINEFGKVTEIFECGWQPDCLIQFKDADGNIVLEGYGTDH